MLNIFKKTNHIILTGDAMKTILDLKRENVLLRRAIDDAAIMLGKQKKHLVVQYGDNDANFLIDRVNDILLLLEKKQQPTNDASDSKHGG